MLKLLKWRKILNSQFSILNKSLYLCSRFQENRLRNQASPQQRSGSLHSACTDFVALWRDGRVVDYSSLENYRTERYRGFESLSLRQVLRNLLKFQQVLFFVLHRIHDCPRCSVYRRVSAALFGCIVRASMQSMSIMTCSYFGCKLFFTD